MLTDEKGLEILEAEQCLELLAAARLGRIAVTVGAVPAIFPVDYRLLEGQIVFRTGGGTSLYNAAASTVVAFEVDDVDPSWHEGWSVLVVGVAREIMDGDAVCSTLDGAHDLWDPGNGSRVLAILPSFLSGRRFVTAA
jgi:uncharacterized protein